MKMLTEQLLSFLLLIPVTLGQSQVELEMLQEEIFIDGAGCNCTEEINKTKQQVEKKIEDLENQNKNLQDQFNTLQLKLDRLQQRSEGHEACFEDLGSDNCVGSKSGLIGIVEAIRVDGGWGPFSDWSQCSAPCGGGVQVRNRTCNNPAPENGGKPCTGNGEEQRRCNLEQCFDPCRKSLCYSEDGCPLAKNTLLTTLPQLNKEFLVSFEFRATEYISGWQSVIHFTEGGNCCGVGQRVPGFWVGSFGQLTPSFAVDGDGNYHVTTKKQYSANEWHTVVFSQTLKNGKYLYRVVIDGEDVVIPVENMQPKLFYNVKVYAADSYYNSLKGSIRNLAIHSCGGNWTDKETYSPISVQDGCYEEDTDYHGNDLNLSTGRNKDRRDSASECQKLCAQTKRCKFFTWKQSSKECWSKTKGGPGNSRQEKGSVSGPRVCGGRGARDQGRFNFPSQRGSRGGDLFGRIG